MNLSYRTALEIASHEALIRQAYKDSVGVWTWSVGVTSATGHNVERYIGKPQTVERCLEVWIWALRKYADDVEAAFKGFPLTEAQFAAALSFHYNTGSIGKATWVKQVKAGDMAGARKSIMSWKKPPEIIGRRTKERDLFFDGKWSGDGTMTEYTRLTKTSTPVWGSAVKINVETPLKAALYAPVTPKPAPAPQPPPAASKPPVPISPPTPPDPPKEAAVEVFDASQDDKPKGNPMSNWFSGLVASTMFKYLLAMAATYIATKLGLDKGSVEGLLTQAVGLALGAWGMWESSKNKIVVDGRRVTIPPADKPAAERLIDRLTS